MFADRLTKERRAARPVTIELRDGRRLTGTLQLPENLTAQQLLRRATPFLTIRTPQGDLALNRSMISALLLGDEAVRAQDEEKAKVAEPVRPITGTDPCRILNVRPGASRDEIKAAWRKRISQCHPDKVAGRGAADDIVAAAQAQAAAVNAAYRSLMAMRAGA